MGSNRSVWGISDSGCAYLRLGITDIKQSGECADQYVLENIPSSITKCLLSLLILSFHSSASLNNFYNHDDGRGHAFPCLPSYISKRAYCLLLAIIMNTVSCSLSTIPGTAWKRIGVPLPDRTLTEVAVGSQSVWVRDNKGKVWFIPLFHCFIPSCAGNFRSLGIYPSSSCSVSVWLNDALWKAHVPVEALASILTKVKMSYGPIF